MKEYLPEDRIVIPLNRGKIFILSFSSFFFAIMGGAIAFIEPKFFIYMISFFFVCIFGFGFISGIIKLIYDKPGLIITKDGFFDNSSLISFGFVRWENIDYISFNDSPDQEYISIYIKDKDEILENVSTFNQLMIPVILTLFKSSIHISPTFISCNFKELYLSLNFFLDEKKNFS